MAGRGHSLAWAWKLKMGCMMELQRPADLQRPKTDAENGGTALHKTHWPEDVDHFGTGVVLDWLRTLWTSMTGWATILEVSALFCRGATIVEWPARRDWIQSAAFWRSHVAANVPPVVTCTRDYLTLAVGNEGGNGVVIGSGVGGGGYGIFLRGILVCIANGNVPLRYVRRWWKFVEKRIRISDGNKVRCIWYLIRKVNNETKAKNILDLKRRLWQPPVTDVCDRSV